MKTVFRFTLKVTTVIINMDSCCPESGSSFDSEMEFKNETINCSSYQKKPIGTGFYVVDFFGAHIKVGLFSGEIN